MIFRRKSNGDGAAVADSERPDLEQTFGRIDELSRSNRERRDPETERELRQLRHLAGIELLRIAPEDPRHPEPANSVPARGEQSRVPEVDPSELSAELLRASVLEAGCLLVRDVIDDEVAERMAADIDRAHEIRGRLDGGVDPGGYYDELEPIPPYAVEERDWVREGGGVLAADSPRLLFDMLDGFEQAGLRQVITGYLGERPAISAQKCTLRKATPDVAGAWHQDGSFMGEVRSINVWLSLSRCGDVAPSMDIVPRRLDRFVEMGTEGTWLETQVSDAVAAEAAGEVGIVRPIFNPGDALIFDDLFLHQTGSDPSMPNPRYAIESWFFGPSAYPRDYVPIAF